MISEYIPYSIFPSSWMMHYHTYIHIHIKLYNYSNISLLIIKMTNDKIYYLFIFILSKMWFLRNLPRPDSFWIRPNFFAFYGRFVERMGVFFYNEVISRTSLGLKDPRWNPRVHGIYCHFRYYGKCLFYLFYRVTTEGNFLKSSRRNFLIFY